MKKLSFGVLLLLWGCQGPTPPASFPQRLAPFEMKGELMVAGGQLYPLWLSTKKDRYRLEKDGKVYIGPLKGAGDTLVLDQQTRTVFRYSPTRARELSSARTTAASRYTSAVRDSRVKDSQMLVRQLFGTPCQRATQQMGGHYDCQHQGNHWIHRVQRRHNDLRSGFSSYTSVLEHDYDPQRGLILDEVRSTEPGTTSSSSGGVRVETSKALPAQLFEVPAGYTEPLQLEKLEKDTRQPVGWPGMLSQNRPLMRAETYYEDSPPLPTQPRWSVLRERWIRSDSTRVVEVLQLATAVPLTPEAATSDPPRQVSWDFPVQEWSARSEVGDRSCRVADDTVVFQSQGVLFKVKVFPEKVAKERLLPLCRELAAKAPELLKATRSANPAIERRKGRPS
jgi:hypothetical protein